MAGTRTPILGRIVSNGRVVTSFGDAYFDLLDYADFSTASLGATFQSFGNWSLARPSEMYLFTATSSLVRLTDGVIGIGLVIGTRADVTSSVKGAIFEPARTNLIPTSRQISSSGAFWNAALGATLTNDFSVGPDGLSLADREQVNSGGRSQYINITASLGATYTFSEMIRPVTGSASSWELRAQPISYGASSMNTANWFPAKVVNSVADATIVAIVPMDGRNNTAIGGIAAGARDQQIDFMQYEAGFFATSPIYTSGSVKTRSAATIAYSSPGVVIPSGRIKAEVKFVPYDILVNYSGSNVRLLTEDANNYVEFNSQTTSITVVAGGVSWSPKLNAAWQPCAPVSVYVDAGPTTNPIIAFSNSNGPFYAEVGTSPLGTFPTTNPIYFGSNTDGTLHLASGLQYIKFYNTGTTSQPDWVINTPSAFQPDWIPGIIGWYRGDNVTTSGSNVTAWQNMVTGTYNVISGVQVTVANQPIYNLTAALGYPCVTFISASQTSLAFFGFKTYMSTSGGEIFCVTRPEADPTPASAGNRGLLNFQGGGATRFPGSTGGAGIFDAFGSTLTNVFTYPTGSLATWNVLNAQSIPNYREFLLNGSRLNKSTTNTVNIIPSPTLGMTANTSPNYFQGDVAEMVVFGRRLNDTERFKMNAYFNARYLIPISASSI